jgi:hypothetical protein
MGKRIVSCIGLGLLFLVFFISMHTTVYAQWLQDEGCTDVQTDSGEEHPVPPNWHSNPNIIKIIASSDTIAPGGTVTLSVDSQSFALPPYSWTTSGAGYTLSASTTSKDLETVTLHSASGTCGSSYSPRVTVTATDNRGVVASLGIRNTGGTWTLVGAWTDGACTSGYCGAGKTCTITDTVYDGAFKKWNSAGAPPPFSFSDCYGRGGESRTVGGWYSCPGDTIYRSETSCGSDCCWCSVYYYYWTCGGGC